MARYRVYFFNRENALADLTEIHCDTEQKQLNKRRKKPAAAELRFGTKTAKSVWSVIKPRLVWKS